MRIWDLPPHILCRQHLLGEHRELHALWTILTKGKSGYQQHPETIRWVGKLSALYGRHEELVMEMEIRGYHHKTPLDKSLAGGEAKQTQFVHRPSEQREIIKNKHCDCRV